MNYKEHIIEVKDYPKEGISFKDLTPLWQDKKVFKSMISDLCKPFEKSNVDIIASVESRGFVTGAPMSVHMNAGFVPLRKAGKLPRNTFKESFELEYGSSEIHIHEDAISNQNILIADDLLATGGTAIAAYNLITKHFPNANIVGFSFIVALDYLDGLTDLQTLGIPIHSLVEYA
jgi:adenine phosphoribosyltransferase